MGSSWSPYATCVSGTRPFNGSERTTLRWSRHSVPNFRAHVQRTTGSRANPFEAFSGWAGGGGANAPRIAVDEEETPWVLLDRALKARHGTQRLWKRARRRLFIFLHASNVCKNLSQGRPRESQEGRFPNNLWHSMSTAPQRSGVMTSCGLDVPHLRPSLVTSPLEHSVQTRDYCSVIFLHGRQTQNGRTHFLARAQRT